MPKEVEPVLVTVVIQEATTVMVAGVKYEGTVTVDEATAKILKKTGGTN